MITKIQQHQLPVLDKEKHKTISFSQYQVYKQCPLKWYLQYVEKRWSEPSVILIFGTSIHHTIQEYLRVLFTESRSEADLLDLNNILYQKMVSEYNAEVEKLEGKHFSTAQEMGEYLEDGEQILDYFKEHLHEYITTKQYELVAIEMPLLFNISEEHSDVYYKGFLDIVLYDKVDDLWLIIDAKTSYKGWGDKEKKDEIKSQQLVLYKHYFSKTFNIDVDKIEVQFFILKRKIWENSQFPQKRIQTHIPSSGKIKQKKAQVDISNFIKDCFNPDGTPQIKQYKAQKSSYCKYCQFHKTEFCSL